jgi:hypothetical protein
MLIITDRAGTIESTSREGILRVYAYCIRGEGGSCGKRARIMRVRGGGDRDNEDREGREQG